MIDNGNFNRLSLQKRNMLIDRLRRLFNQLLGFVPQHKLKNILGALVLLISMEINTGCKKNKEVTPQPKISFVAPKINPFGLDSIAGFYTKPSFADIDGDGDFDAFVGNSGALQYFQNTGTKTSPAFAAPISNPFGLVSFFDASPAFVDIDGDGDFDAFSSGGYYGSSLVYFENIGTNTTPIFDTLQINPFGLGGGYLTSAPAFVDIDADGDFDILGSDYYGVYFENIGTNTTPAFDTARSKPFGLNNYILTNPAFIDIDGDGDFDVFMGGYYGSIMYIENSGTVTSPVFGTILINPWGLKVADYQQSYYLAFTTFVDIDADGDFDAFIGSGGYYPDPNRRIYYFENTSP